LDFVLLLLNNTDDWLEMYFLSSLIIRKLKY